ncbi:MAG: hypothetical protein JSS79_10275 [Bacteroidetes bacterium]|nr:hypothetical protein [Bacteroidota bacterium]
MKNAFALLIISSIVFGCQKSEKDFIGSYHSFYVTKVNLPNGSNMMGMMFGVKAKQLADGQEFDDLGDIGIELFADQSGKEVKGEAVIVIKKVMNAGFGLKETSEKLNFDVTNLRLNGDTLVGNLENQVLRLTGKKIKLSLVKNGTMSVVGIGNDLGVKNSDNNPLLVSSNAGFHFFKCLDEQEVRNEERAFFEKEEKDLNTKLEIEKDETKKQIIKNSLVEIKSRLNNK